MSFEGKVILITGASGGIGQACAEYFAKEGALLALVGRNPDKFQQLVENFAENGIEIEPLIIYADVTQDAERIINETIDKYDHLDILINNAGFAIPGSIENITVDDFDASFAVNVKAIFELTKLAIPSLIDTKGSIINVSSVCGMRPFPEMIAYSVSKAALDHMTKCLALDLASKGVRVNAINPGFIDTDFHTCRGIQRNSDEYAELIEQQEAIHPLGRVGQPDDVVNAIVTLVSERSSFITGIIFPCDGGLSSVGPR